MTQFFLVMLIECPGDERWLPVSLGWPKDKDGGSFRSACGLRAILTTERDAPFKESDLVSFPRPIVPPDGVSAGHNDHDDHLALLCLNPSFTDPITETATIRRVHEHGFSVPIVTERVSAVFIFMVWAEISLV